MSPLTRLPFVLLVQELFEWLPLGCSVRIMQAGHFDDLSFADFVVYVQKLKNEVIRTFEAVFQFGISVPPLSYRHRPAIFFDPWHRETALVWLNARAEAYSPSAAELAHVRLSLAARRLLGITAEQPGAFQRFLDQDPPQDTCTHSQPMRCS